MDGNLVSDQRLLRLELVRDLNGDGAMATAAPRPLEARGLPPRLAKPVGTWLAIASLRKSNTANRPNLPVP